MLSLCLITFDDLIQSFVIYNTGMFPFVKSLNNSFYERKNVTRNDYSLKDERKIFYACGLNIVKVSKLPLLQISLVHVISFYQKKL